MSTQLGSLRRFLAQSAPRRAAGGGTALVVGSGKGGTGTTTLAALLALIGAAEGRRTLLVDADRGLATAHLLLGVESGPGLGALRDGLSPHDLLVPGAENLSLLTCGAPIDDPHGALGGAEWQALLRRVPACYGDFDLIVVDSGSRLDGVRGIGSLGAGRLLAVTTADRISLAATHALVKVSTAQQPGLRTGLVVNRSSEPEARGAFAVLQEGIGRFLARTVEFIGVLPDDPRFREGIDRGQTILEAASRAALADAVRDLAPQLIPSDAPAMAAPPRVVTG
jgi:MinD-like ATPase involved in chromosome partitioning or flagellar assembly